MERNSEQCGTEKKGAGDVKGTTVDMKKSEREETKKKEVKVE